MNKLMKYIIGSVVSLGILLGVGTMTSDSVAHGANEPKCPEVWPEYVEGYGINFEGFYGDYFIIISTSSNDSTMGRAYPKDDRYEVGYTPGTPAETCYVNLDTMKQSFFSDERDTRSESKSSELAKEWHFGHTSGLTWVVCYDSGCTPASLNRELAERYDIGGTHYQCVPRDEFCGY